jgi:hypothetical protein
MAHDQMGSHAACHKSGTWDLYSTFLHRPHTPPPLRASLSSTLFYSHWGGKKVLRYMWSFPSRISSFFTSSLTHPWKKHRTWIHAHRSRTTITVTSDIRKHTKTPLNTPQNHAVLLRIDCSDAERRVTRVLRKSAPLKATG